MLPEHDMTVHANHVDVAEGSSTEDAGSTFKGFAAVVNFPEYVMAALHQIMRLPIVATATHRIIYAYRIGNGSAGITTRTVIMALDGDLLNQMRSSGDTNTVRIGIRVCSSSFENLKYKYYFIKIISYGNYNR